MTMQLFSFQRWTVRAIWLSGLLLAWTASPSMGQSSARRPWAVGFNPGFRDLSNGGVASAACAWAAGFHAPGADNSVLAFTVFNDGLYAGGTFTTVGDMAANRIARWDGSTWSVLGSGMSGTVNALTVFNDGLYAGGDFTTAGGVTVNRIAKWNGTTWSALGSGTNGTVSALAVFDAGTGPALYAGGSFTTAGGVTVDRVAKWNGSTWSALTSSLQNDVRALTVFNDWTGAALYAGGFFSIAGGGAFNRIAKWNGTTWSAVGSGMGSTVFGLTVFNEVTGSALYAGGTFTTAGGVPANRIAKWNGTTWSALGSGVDSTVNTLTVSNDGTGSALYAGGLFTTAGGVSASRIAKWNGTTWSALGRGVNNTVNALTVFNDGPDPALHVGGAFTASGNVTINRIARWDGTLWSSPGSGNGMSNAVTVNTLTVFNDGSDPDLYAGGSFIAAGGGTVNRVAKWDGTTWSALPRCIECTTNPECDDGNGCTTDTCQDGSCVFRNNSVPCNDDSACTTDDTCLGGVCVGGAPADCDDGNVCTDDSCNPAGGCVNVNNTAPCNDGNACTTGDACAGGLCISGPPLNCNDGNVCTDDSCVSLTGCVHANNTSSCDDAHACTSGDVCGGGICAGTPTPSCIECTTTECNDGKGCTTDTCSGGACVFTNNTDPCNDGNACTTGDTCTAGSCVGGPPPNCDDGIVCTTDSCDPPTGCTHTNNAVTCSDGNACTTNDTCSGGLCVSGPAPNCNDGNVCTDDSCNPTSGCVHTNNSNLCDDAHACTSGDVCGGGVCMGALPASGMDGTVNALRVFNAGLYVGGAFTTAGGVSASRIARWDGTTWSALGSGMNNTVNSLTVFNNDLYVGGSFTTAGGVSADRIAKWNGTTWSALGSGMAGSAPVVRALTVFNDGTGPALYAGGFFSTAGGVAAPGIAKWNGSTWSGLGSGMGGTFPSVFALAVFDDGPGPALYAGGQFATAGGVTVNRIARWDGSNWSVLGSGINNTVNALTVFADATGRALYAGGAFTTAGGVGVNRIAGWGGATWSALGNGTSASVLAITFFDDGTDPALYAGGTFTTAGGIPSSGVAKWECTCTPPDCDEGNVCTPATCDLKLGCVQHDGTGVTIPCNDRNACTAQGVCHGDAAGTCDPGPWCILDLDTNGVMGTGDFARFSPCFGACYCTPPGDPCFPGGPCLASNFNGDAGGCIGTSDFAMFAGCFGNTCGQCAVCTGAAAESAVAGTDSSDAGATASIQVAVVARPTPMDVAPLPPASVPQLQVGQKVWIELWGTLNAQSGASPRGLASAYIDVQYDPTLLAVTDTDVSQLFPVFAGGTNNADTGTVRALGGCATPGDRIVGADGMWVRIATLAAVAQGGGNGVITAGPSDDLHGLAVVGELQNIDPDRIDFGAARVNVSGKRHLSRSGR